MIMSLKGAFHSENLSYFFSDSQNDFKNPLPKICLISNEANQKSLVIDKTISGGLATPPSFLWSCLPAKSVEDFYRIQLSPAHSSFSNILF